MRRILRLSVVATTLYVGATLFYGIRSHSLALISEAGHNASDVLALLLSYVALHFQHRAPDDRHTFGYGRAGVLAAFLNALSLILISAWIAWLALIRFIHPVSVQPHVMETVAAIGVLMNGAIAALLWKQSHDVNIRGAFLHMLGDTLSTAAVIVGGVVISWTGLRWIDPALSLVIATLIAWSSLGIVRETMNILLEGTPIGVNLRDVRAVMQGVEGVSEVHDLHIWSVGSGSRALASHVTIGDVAMSDSERILRDLLEQLRAGFGIAHATIQFERQGCPTENGCSGMVVEDGALEHAHHHHHHGHSHHHH